MSTKTKQKYDTVSLTISHKRLASIYEEVRKLFRKGSTEKEVYFQSGQGCAAARATNGREILLMEVIAEENEEGVGQFVLSLDRLKKLAADKHLQTVHFKASDSEDEVTVLAENGDVAVEQSTERCEGKELPGTGILKGAKFHPMPEAFARSLAEACSFTSDNDRYDSILLDFDKQAVVATDTRQLYVAKTDFPITRGRSFLRKTKFLEKISGDCQIAVLDSHIAIHADSCYYVSIREDRGFPNWSSVADQKNKFSWLIEENRAEVVSFTRKVVAAGKKSKEEQAIDFAFVKGGVKLNYLEETLDIKDTKVDFQESITLNPHYFDEILALGFDALAFSKPNEAVCFSESLGLRKVYIAPMHNADAKPAYRESVKARPGRKTPTDRTSQPSGKKQRVSLIEKGESSPVTEVPEETTTSHCAAIPVQILEDRDWVWVKFSEKPEQDIIDELKFHKFRWSKRRKAWFKKELGIPEFLTELAETNAV